MTGDGWAAAAVAYDLWARCRLHAIVLEMEETVGDVRRGLWIMSHVEPGAWALVVITETGE